MTLVNQVASIFNIRSGEIRAVLLLLAYSLLNGLIQTLSYTAGFSLFLTEFGSAQMPWVYLLITLLGIAATLAHLQMQKRFPMSVVLLGSAGLALLLLLIFRLGLALPRRHSLIFALPAFAVVVVHVKNFEFWNVAGRLLDVRQGKRLFGLVGSGEMVARTVGGLLTPALVARWGAANLLVFSIAAAAGTLLLITLLRRHFPAQLDARTEKNAQVETGRKKAQSTDAEESIWRRRYILLTFLAVGLGWIALRFIDNVYLFYAELQYPDEVQLASFFGLFDAASSTLALLVMLVASGRFMGRWGVTGGLLAYPLTMFIFALFFVLADFWRGPLLLLFGLTVIMRLLENVLRKAINGPAIQLLYQPLPPAQRSRTQTIASGLIASIGAGLGAILLLILYTFLGLTWLQLTLILLGILAVWIGAVVEVSRAYPRKLLAAIIQRRIGHPAFSLEDPAAVAVLEQALHSPHAGESLYALRSLRAADHPALPRLLPDLLAHPAVPVRIAALQALERTGTAPVSAVYRAATQDADDQVRGQALQTLAMLQEDGAVNCLSSYLGDSSRPVRMGAVLGLLRHGGVEGVLLAGEPFLAWQDSPLPEERQFAADVIGAMGTPSFARYLLPLLHDAVPKVQQAALVAAKAVPDPRLWPVIIELLPSPELHGDAAAALVAGGDPVLPLLREAMTEPAHVLKTRLRLARVCGKIGGEEAIALLQTWNETPHGALRTQILIELSRCGYQIQDDQSDAERTWIEPHLHAEGAHCAWLLAALCTARAHGHILLGRALNAELDAGQQRLFFWLSFLSDAEAVFQVREALAQADGERRAYAREVLELLIPNGLRSWILPLIDDLPPEQRLAQVAPHFPQSERSPAAWLEALLTEASPGGLRPDAWTQSVALAALVDVHPVRASELSHALCHTLCHAADPLLRDTAAWALAKLNPNHNEFVVPHTSVNEIAIGLTHPEFALS